MRISYDISTKNFSVVEDETFFLNEFCFTDEGKLPVSFDNLSFGMIIKRGKEKILEETLPINEIQYLSTDQEVLESIASGDLLKGEDYDYTVWVSNGGEKVEHSFVRTVPVPKSPYPSWHWSGPDQRWLPPIPYPNPDDSYVWDEDNQEWIQVHDEL